VCRAYDVLSNPEYKGTYDLYGWHGLSVGIYGEDGKFTVRERDLGGGGGGGRPKSLLPPHTYAPSLS